MLTSTEKPSLTARQTQILAFIDAQPFPPTMREIGAAFGITSPNAVASHLKALEKKGAIGRARKKARGIIREIDRNPQPTWCSLPFGGMIG